MRLKLYHRSILLGEITHISQEGAWMSGDLEPTPALEDYRVFFNYMTDESKGQEEPPFGDDYLDPNTWIIVDNSGKNRKIEVPAVHSDNSIEWRWQ
jgi:hypothetical protein